MNVLITAPWYGPQDEGGGVARQVQLVAEVGREQTLGRVLRRPTILPTPTVALKALFGGDAVDEMFLGGQRVVPAKLQASGYDFRHPTLEPALRALV